MYEFKLQRPPVGPIPSRDPKAAVQRRLIVGSLFGAVALGVLAGIVLKPTTADRPAAEQRPVRKVVSQDVWPEEVSIVVDSRLPEAATPLPSMTPASVSIAPDRAPFVETAFRPEPPTTRRTRRQAEPEFETADREYEPFGPPDDSCVFVGPDEVVCGEDAPSGDFIDEDFSAETPPHHR